MNNLIKKLITLSAISTTLLTTNAFADNLINEKFMKEGHDFITEFKLKPSKKNDAMIVTYEYDNKGNKEKYSFDVWKENINDILVPNIEESFKSFLKEMPDNSIQSLEDIIHIRQSFIEAHTSGLWSRMMKKYPDSNNGPAAFCAWGKEMGILWKEITKCDKDFQLDPKTQFAYSYVDYYTGKSNDPYVLPRNKEKIAKLREQEARDGTPEKMVNFYNKKYKTDFKIKK